MVFKQQANGEFKNVFYAFHQQDTTRVICQNNIIKRVTQHKLLGVTIDDALTFKSHVSELCINLSSNVPLLYQVKDLVPKHVLRVLYNAHVVALREVETACNDFRSNDT